MTFGVLYEIDEKDFERLKKYEPGYNPMRKTVYVDCKPTNAVTFISSSLSDVAPSNDYVEKICQGAEEKGLPVEYIKNIRRISGLHQ